MILIAAALLFAAVLITHLFFGGGDGTRLIYVLPGYILLGLAGILSAVAIRKAPGRINRGCLIATACAGTYFFVRIATSPSEWLAQFDFFAVLAALLMYAIMAIWLTGNGVRTVLVIGLILLGVSQVGIGVYQFVKDPNFNPLLAENRAGVGFRASGLFISPNHLAGFLEVAFLLATSFCFWGGFRARGRVVMGYFALVCLGGLVLTGSRGGYLSAGVGAVVFTCLSIWTLRSRLSRRLLPRLVGMVIAVSLLGTALAILAEHSFAIRTRTNTVFASEDVRFHLWKAAWDQSKLSPVVGTGARTYVYYGRTYRTPQVDVDPVFAHSDWLQTLAEYGFAGIALIGVFVVVHLGHASRRWSRMVGRFSSVTMGADERHALALQIGTISALAACLVHAVMDFNLHIPANLLVTSFLFGLLATRRTCEIDTAKLWPARLLHTVPSALGVWVLAVSIPRVQGELLVESARGKFASGKIGPALEDTGRALGRGVRNPNLHFQIGEVQRVLSNHFPSADGREAAMEEAQEAYGDAVAIFPQDVGLVVRNAWALGRLGRFEQADAMIARAKELDPNSPKVWLISALNWQRRDKPAEALAEYRRAQAVDSGWIPNILAELNEQFDVAAIEKSLEPAGELTRLSRRSPLDGPRSLRQ